MEKLEFYSYATTKNLARVSSYLIATQRAFTFNCKEIEFTATTDAFQEMLETDHILKEEDFTKVYYNTYDIYSSFEDEDIPGMPN